MFGEKLKKLRQNIDMTQEELADKLNVSRPAVSKWETGKGYPSLESLKDIADLFGISIDELISDEDIKIKKKIGVKVRRRTIIILTAIVLIIAGIWFFRAYIYGVPVDEYVTDIEITETHTFKEPGEPVSRATDYRITCEFWDSSLYVYGHHKIKETEQGYELIVYGVKPSVFNEEKRFTFDIYLDRSVLRINNIYRIYPEGTIAGDENWIRYEKLYWLRGTRMADKESVEEIITLMEIDRYILPYEVEIYDSSLNFNFEENESPGEFLYRYIVVNNYFETLFVLIEDLERVDYTLHVGKEQYTREINHVQQLPGGQWEIISLKADNPKIIETIFRKRRLTLP